MSQAAGVGDAADALLLSWAYATFGWHGLCAMWRVLAAVIGAARATDDAKLDRAAHEFAVNLSELGMNALLVFITWAAGRGAGKSIGEEPHPPPEPEVSRPAQRTVTNSRTLLPRSNGYWDGEPGESGWHSTKPEVNAITNGEPVQFRNGRPDFSPWSQGEITFKDGLLNGTDSDYSRVYDYIKSNSDLANQDQAREFLRSQGLSPHHLDLNTIQLVPRVLNQIPHIGAASDLRGLP